MLFALWISPDFQAWCIDALDELFQKGTVSIVRPSYTYEDEIERALAWAEEKRQDRLKLEQKDKVIEQKEQMIVEHVKEIEYQKDVISGVVEDIDIATMRTFLNRIVRHKQSSGIRIQQRYQKIYRLYKETGEKVDLITRMNNANDKIKKKKNQYQSVIDYAEKHGHLKDLYEIAVRYFETDVQAVMDEILDNK